MNYIKLALFCMFTVLLAACGQEASETPAMPAADKVEAAATEAADSTMTEDMVDQAKQMASDATKEMKEEVMAKAKAEADELVEEHGDDLKAAAAEKAKELEEKAKEKLGF